MSEHWTVSVDPGVCRCNAVCVSVAPELFVLDDEIARVTAEAIEESSLELAEEAEALCPTQAITVERLSPALVPGG